MSFLTNNKELRQLRPKVFSFYRLCLKVIRDLPHQKQVYYDYTRLKFKENAALTDAKKIRFLISSGEEELEWVRKILDYRAGSTASK
jgi:Complex 1 protein (LYR family)